MLENVSTGGDFSVWSNLSDIVSSGPDGFAMLANQRFGLELLALNSMALEHSSGRRVLPARERGLPAPRRPGRLPPRQRRLRRRRPLRLHQGGHPILTRPESDMRSDVCSKDPSYLYTLLAR